MAGGRKKREAEEETSAATALRNRRDLETVDLSRRDQSFSFRMREIVKLFSRGLAVNLGKFGITPGQWQFLRALWEEEGLSQAELSERLGLTSAATVFSINLLERDGLAWRRRDAEDGRKFLIYLTPKGKRLRALLVPFARDIQIEALAGFSDTEIEILAGLCDRIKANLERVAAARQAAAPPRERRPKRAAR